MGGWVGGWMDGLVGLKAILRIAYSNQTYMFLEQDLNSGLPERQAEKVTMPGSLLF